MADTSDTLSDSGRGRTYDALPRDRGTYLVTTTTGTTYRFDLAHRTVTRTPGPGSTPGFNDGAQTLRTVDACRVGAPGFWTMIAGDFFTDFYMQQTTVIVSIVDASPTATPASGEDAGRP